jgi:hypothetical protein
MSRDNDHSREHFKEDDYNRKKGVSVKSIKGGKAPSIKFNAKMVKAMPKDEVIRRKERIEERMHTTQQQIANLPPEDKEFPDFDVERDRKMLTRVLKEFGTQLDMLDNRLRDIESLENQ